MSSFSKLFKKYRLRSEFETLSEFGDALALEGVPYENSLFSRWQKGERVPRNRKLIVTIIKIFIKRNGISFLKEANQFLESTGQGYLTENEIHLLPKNVITSSPFQAPKEIDHFTGREIYINQIKKLLLKGRIVLIHGPAGMGKTSLAIKLAHMLREEYTDGVLWFRVDTSSSMDILASIAYTYGENISNIKDLYNRASYVRSLLTGKKVLLVFDNIEPHTKLSLLVPNSSSSSVLLTSRYKTSTYDFLNAVISLEVFQEKESLQLFNTILGKGYLRKNKGKLLEIARLLDNLPLAISIFAKQLLSPPQNISKLLSQLRKERIQLESLGYEDTNLLSSLNVSYQNLSPNLQKIFISLGIFGGPDFSGRAVAYVNKLSSRDSKKLMEQLVINSLLQQSSETRYRLHPMIKIFIQEKLNNLELYERAATYYVKLMAKSRIRSLSFYPFIRYELDNVYSILDKCFQFQKRESVLNLSKHFFTILWEIGHWNNLERLGEKVYRLASKFNYRFDKVRCCVRELSWVYYWTGNIDKAKKYTNEGLHIAQEIKDEYLIHYAKERMGKIYAAQGKYPEAIKVLTEALSYFNKMKDSERTANSLRYIGETYMWLEQFDKAIIFLNRSAKN